MQQIKELNSGEKYLKATQAASYHSEIAYEGSHRTFSPTAFLKDSWINLKRESRYFVSEYAVSNAAVLAFLTKAPSLQHISRKSSHPVIDKTQFAFNWICALVGLICLFPLFGIIGLAVKLDSPGPVFYRQERVGLNRRRRDRRGSGDVLLNCRRSRERRRENLFGKPFTVYKFRTMVVDAEKHCGPIWASKNDPRITRMGRVLRRTRLDELPQLFNVLRGEMSIVGPRPERPHFTEKLSNQIEAYTKRLQVLPGITGLAQVTRGYDGSLDDVKVKINYDLQYIRNANIKTDVKIMFRTVGVMLSRRGM